MAAVCAQAPAPHALAGWWVGTLQGTPLRLEMHVVAATGGLSGTFISLDQGNAKFPASAIKVDGARVTIAAAAAGGSYAGTLSADGQRLSGTWSQNGHSGALDFARRQGPVAAAARPQEPKPPFPYRSIDVTVPSVDGIKLAGTLTLPRGKGPFPAALLIAGSGPNGRNEEVAGHKIFLVLADALTRHGLAVLRMDKRGIGQSGGDAEAATLNDYARDVAADLSFLDQRADIDHKAIGLIGHSEGGDVAAMAAAGHAPVAFVVLLAGPAVPGTDLIVAQVEAIDKAAGMSPAAAAASGKIEKVFVHTVASAPNAAAVPAALRAAVKAGKLPKGVLRGSATAATPEYYSLLRFDPAPYLRKLRCPVLALDGSKDVQVPAALNIPALRADLSQDPHATVVELPGLNHLFQPAKTGALSEYREIETTFAPAALARIERWLAEVVGTQP